mmetsp:Transcript_11258/g.30138  ORF Transcript_11258/g.30138 Transcript_11258/m.30138 type:complete len:280 (+) Transcript_11258:765-1604(+)
MPLQQSWHHPLVQLVSCATLLQDPLQRTALHHVRVFEVCELVRKHRPVLIEHVPAVSLCGDIGEPVMACGERLVLRDVCMRFAVQVSVVLCFPDVLSHRLGPPRSCELLFLGLIPRLWFFVTRIQKHVISPLPAPSQNLHPSAIPKFVALVLEHFLEVLVAAHLPQRRNNLWRQSSSAVHQVSRGDADMSRQVLEEPLHLYASQGLTLIHRLLSLLSSRVPGTCRVVGGSIPRTLPRILLAKSLLQEAAAETAPRWLCHRLLRLLRCRANSGARRTSPL